MRKKVFLFIIIMFGLLGIDRHLLPQDDTLCKLIIESKYPHLVSPQPATYRDECGKSIELEATGSEFYRFDHWEGVSDQLKYRGKITIVVNQDMKVVAHFKETGPVPEDDLYILHINKIGKGAVSPSGEKKVPGGQIVKLEAKAAQGWVFQQWTGSVTGTQPVMPIEIRRNMKITAVFRDKNKPKINIDEPTAVKPTEPLVVTNKKGEIFGPYDKAKIKRGTVNAERLLSNYLYYFKGKQLRRIDTDENKPSEYTIENNDQRLNPDNYYNTSIYPNENETGNRFIVFYDKGWKDRPSFIVYDKLEDTFDNDSFKVVDSKYQFFTRIYPVDYSAGGDYIQAAFIAVYMYLEKGKRREAIVQYEKSKDNQVVRKELAKNVLSHYYNPYEKKLAWLKQLTTKKTNKIKIQFYDVNHEKITKPKTLSCRQGYKPALMFMAYGYFVINSSKSGSLITNIYHIDKDLPLEEYKYSRLIAYSLRHNKGEFHLLISRGTLLHHKEFNQNAMNVRLRDGRLPAEILTRVKNDRKNKIKSILFLVRRNTYYICIITRTGEKESAEGYDLKAYMLSENFGRVIKECKMDPLPDWLKSSSADLAFSAEGNVIDIQSLTAGRSKGIAYINKWGELKFKPQDE